MKSLIIDLSQTESNTYIEHQAFHHHKTLNKTLCVHYSPEKVKENLSESMKIALFNMSKI